MHAAISIKNVSKNYGALQALDDVSLSIDQGEFFGLLGPNGAGKTTLISILAGLVTADRGHAEIMGADVQSQFRDARRMLGVVPQELVFDPFFTTKSRGGGTGLGLSVVAGLVREWGGAIDVKRVPGATVFTVYVPLAEAERQAAE